MSRGALIAEDYKPQFAGHETFPLKYGWLKKAFDFSSETPEDPLAGFGDPSAIARLGVGKNMVSSMRFWAQAVGVLPDPRRQDVAGDDWKRFWATIFQEGGQDPFMENPATTWLIHWRLASSPQRTTWFWAFSHFNVTSFDRDHLVKGLMKLAEERSWPRCSASTIRRDVECFLRTYCPKPVTAKTGHDDALESPLVELGLIRPVGRRDGFRFVRGEKSSLSDEVFALALVEFAATLGDVSTISFESIAHHEGSPGRVLLLDEDELAERLMRIGDVTSGKIGWSETAGLKQVVMRERPSVSDALRRVSASLRARKMGDAA